MAMIVMRHIGRLMCGADGHTFVVRHEPNRMLLECTSCGYQSHGWDVGKGVLASVPAATAAASEELEAQRDLELVRI
jgi:hypothetical protein